jgi:hypothetical protein
VSTADARRLGGCAALAVVFFLVAVLTRGTEILVPDAPWALGASRYIILPVMFLLTALLVAVDRPHPGARRIPVREVAAALTVLAVIAVNYATPHRTAGGPRWKPTLEQARAHCASMPAGSSRKVTVPINPPVNWYVPIECAELHD